MSNDSISNIRTLHMTREMWIFIGVLTLMSAVYLHQTTSQAAIEAVRTESITPQVINPGQTLDVALTLVTADAFGLACSSDQTFEGGAHCAFKKDGEPWKAEPGEPPGNVPAPYMTVDNVLFVIPNMWQEPVLKKRLEDEPPNRIPVEERENHRFTTACKLKIEKKIENFSVRWQPGAAWGPRDSAFVGRVSGCKITG